MSRPTGQQFEIAFDGARVVVTEVGAGLRSYTVDGVPYVESYPDQGSPPMGAGAVLAPWPNRVAGARWDLDGHPQQLDVTEPVRGNAIHGLVRHARWRVVEQRGSLISLEIGVHVQPGWPVPLRTTVSYALDEHGLTVTYGVHNLGGRAVPFGVGTHPYPRAGMSDTEDCVLMLSASTVLPLDPQRMVPSGPPEPVDGTEFDFRAGRPLSDARLDTPFGGCLPGRDGLVHHELTGPLGGVSMWADPDFRWVQVYTPDTFPGRGRAVAIEPMTCPPDALNSGVDLIVLRPGDFWAARWGLTPLC